MGPRYENSKRPAPPLEKAFIRATKKRFENFQKTLTEKANLFVVVTLCLLESRYSIVTLLA